MNNKATVLVASILGVVFLLVAVLYFTQTAGSLPGFFPGHETGAAAMTHKHAKHGIAALVVGIACFVFAWFASGNKSTSPAQASEPTSTGEKS